MESKELVKLLREAANFCVGTMYGEGMTQRLRQAADELEKGEIKISPLATPGLGFRSLPTYNPKPKKKKLERLPLITTEWNLEKKRTAALIIIRLNEIIDYLNTERVEKDAE